MLVRYIDLYLFINLQDGLRLKSSPYGLDILGYTRVTIVKTESYDCENMSKSLKIF